MSPSDLTSQRRSPQGVLLASAPRLKTRPARAPLHRSARLVVVPKPVPASRRSGRERQRRPREPGEGSLQSQAASVDVEAGQPDRVRDDPEVAWMGHHGEEVWVPVAPPASGSLGSRLDEHKMGAASVEADQRLGGPAG